MVKLGLQVPWFSWPGAPDNHRQVLADVARTAEDEGLDSLWVMDHFFQLPMIGEPTMDMHEAYTTLGYLAGVTERITLGTMVTGISYRNPGLLVKAVTSLDVLSGGRAWCAVGAGWFEREHLGLGFHFGTFTERFEKLEEALRIALQMWSGDNGPYSGKHFQLEETICVPQPIRKPHPPILIGGGGERKTLRMVAQYADATNLFGEPALLRQKLDVLKRWCDELGRDYAAIEKTCLLTAMPGACGDLAKSLVAEGAEHLIFNLPAVHTLDVIRQVAKEIRDAAS